MQQNQKTNKEFRRRIRKCIELKKDGSRRDLTNYQFSSSFYRWRHQDQRSWVQCPEPHRHTERQSEASRVWFQTPSSVLCPLPQSWNPSCHGDPPTGPGRVTAILGPSFLLAPIYLREALLRASDEITIKCQANFQGIFKYQNWTVFQSHGRQAFLIRQSSTVALLKAAASPTWINTYGTLARKLCFFCFGLSF